MQIVILQPSLRSGLQIGLKFFIDIGANASVIPPKTINRHIKALSNRTLFADNGTGIIWYSPPYAGSRFAQAFHMDFTTVVRNRRAPHK